jgi:hypothetical protein
LEEWQRTQKAGRPKLRWADGVAQMLKILEITIGRKQLRIKGGGGDF